MANIAYNRLRCSSFVTNLVGGRVFNYDGVTASLDGNTDVLTIANVKATATWNTAVNSPFRKGDLILISCTDGAISATVESVNSTTGVPTVQWLDGTATS
jgi:maleate cis-trans isomerase